MINMCDKCLKIRFKSIDEYTARLAEVKFKKENLLCYHTYCLKNTKLFVLEISTQ